MERRTKLKKLCETRWSARADALDTFSTAFSVIVPFLETLKADHDDKTALGLNAILRLHYCIGSSRSHSREDSCIDSIPTVEGH